MCFESSRKFASAGSAARLCPSIESTVRQRRTSQCLTCFNRTKTSTVLFLYVKYLLGKSDQNLFITGVRENKFEIPRLFN